MKTLFIIGIIILALTKAHAKTKKRAAQRQNQEASFGKQSWF